MDPALAAQMTLYEPWLIITGVVVLFILLRMTRGGLRRRVDEIGYRLMRERGLLIWFWLNAPGVVLHELSHALVVLLFHPFGFRISRVTLFQIQPKRQNGRSMQPQAVQLGEVAYIRPRGHLMSHVGDGLSAIAPLFGGIAMLAFLYWVATGYNLWDIHLQLLHPGWPWWTLLFAPYLILTVTSELWPSHQDWRGARWLMSALIFLAIVVGGLLWFTKVLIFNDATLRVTTSIASHIDFALLILLILDGVFLIIAELIVRAMR